MCLVSNCHSISIIQNTYFNSLLQELEKLAEDRVGEEMLYEIIEVNKKKCFSCGGGHGVLVAIYNSISVISQSLG